MTPAESTAARRLSWSNHAPLGMPVVPLVQMITTGSVAEPARRASGTVLDATRRAEVVASEHGHVRRQPCRKRAVVEHGQLRFGALEDRSDLARAEPRVQARGDSAESRNGRVGDRIVDRGGQQDRHHVTGAHAAIGEQRRDAVGVVEPRPERDAPVTLDVRLAIPKLLGARRPSHPRP